MKQFTEAVRKALCEKNWYAGLIVALTLPDICGKIENPSAKVGDRYRAWWDKYISQNYISANKCWLGSADAYALRCAVLHEGADDISEQNARKLLTRFVFVHPHGPISMHCNIMSTGLQLDCAIYSEELCRGVDQWMLNSVGNADAQLRLQSLLVILTPGTF